MSPPMPSSGLAENAQANVYAACCTCLPVALIALVLRFIARRLMKAKLWYDDLFIVVAMVSRVPNNLRKASLDQGAFE